MNTDLIVATFNTLTGADGLLKTLKDLQSDDFIEILDAVTVTKDAKGKVEVRQPLEVGPGKGAAFGALTGTIVGLLGGPAGALVGLVSGAATGGVAAAAMEAGLPQKDIKAMAVDGLEPGGSALMVYIDEVWIDEIEDAARAMDAKIARHKVQEKRQIAREKAAELRKEKFDAATKAWQAKVDKLQASVTTLRQQVDSGMKSDRAAFQKQLDITNATLQTMYKNMLQTLRVWQHQVEDDIADLEAEARSANAEAKAAIDRRLASDKEARAALRAHVKDTLTARHNAMKADIEHLKAEAAKAEGQVKEELNQRVAKLQADWDAERTRIDQLDKAEGEAYVQMAKSIDEAYDSYVDAMNEAETKYAKHPN